MFSVDWEVALGLFISTGFMKLNGIQKRAVEQNEPYLLWCSFIYFIFLLSFKFFIFGVVLFKISSTLSLKALSLNLFLCYPSRK